MSHMVVIDNEQATVEVDLEAREWPHVGNFSLKVRLLDARLRHRIVRGPQAGSTVVSRLAEPATFELRLDLYGVLALAVKAARSRGRKAKMGVVKIQGGTPAPRWIHETEASSKEGQDAGPGPGPGPGPGTGG